MTICNYYLVNKETKKIHCLLQLKPVPTDDDLPPSWLSGHLYLVDKDKDMTLEKLYSADYSDEESIMYGNTFHQAFIKLSNISYASYKGYRIYANPEIVQLFDDFAGNDLIEANAFLATIFKKHIGDGEVEKWGTQNFKDAYGVNELVMSHFDIRYDDNLGIHTILDLQLDW